MFSNDEIFNFVQKFGPLTSAVLLITIIILWLAMWIYGQIEEWRDRKEIELHQGETEALKAKCEQDLDDQDDQLNQGT